MSSRRRAGLTWYTKNDQYSKQKLTADLETLRSFYTESRLSRVQRRLDAGVDHAGQGRHLHHDQHHRGPRYTVSDVRLAGELLLPESELRRLVSCAAGRRLSRER